MFFIRSYKPVWKSITTAKPDFALVSGASCGTVSWLSPPNSGRPWTTHQEVKQLKHFLGRMVGFKERSTHISHGTWVICRCRNWNRSIRYQRRIFCGRSCSRTTSNLVE
jgi:hypothetical protein